MFQPERLGKLGPRHRLRKVALLLEEVERELLASPATPARLDYARRLARVLAAFPDTPASLAGLAREFAASGPVEASASLRALDRLRHALIAEAGQAPADWDLLDPETGRELAPRRPWPGVRAWLEDIRSPFNVGSMLRSAEAFGLEELLLSPDCADPGHPRASRSAMGADSLMPWRRAGSEVLEGLGPAFALELGGTPLQEFVFPERGLVVLGSEELGVSAAALGRCSLGKVSIPMRGAKASINVGVAFGVLLSAWTAALAAGRARSV
jgi:TrmH family RNA methyltransferase